MRNQKRRTETWDGKCKDIGTYLRGKYCNEKYRDKSSKIK